MLRIGGRRLPSCIEPKQTGWKLCRTNALIARHHHHYHHQQQQPTLHSLVRGGTPGLGATLAAVALATGAATGTRLAATEEVSPVADSDTGAKQAPLAKDESPVRLVNWSGNHVSSARVVHRPTSLAELEALVREAHEKGIRRRPLGSSISPNGCAFANPKDEQICLDKMDKILDVDEREMTVTVQAGATVGSVVEELRHRGLALENLASINAQQIGGFTQVGAHGTGVSLPPSDEQIVRFTVVTPGKGTLVLSRDSRDVEEARLFTACKQGLGCLGIVAEVTLRVVPLRMVKEKIEVLTREQVTATHTERLQAHKHVKYMWVPHHDHVIVVTVDPITEAEEKELQNQFTREPHPFVKNVLSIADLRTSLLRAPSWGLSTEMVKRINRVETLYYQLQSGRVEVKPADAAQAFDCGSQQLVCELALDASAEGDVDVALRLLRRIERDGIPAPMPIEHRWTASSDALMSCVPAHKSDLYGWIGIVMYLPFPVEDSSSRGLIQTAFRDVYCKAYASAVREAGAEARSHWAKLEDDSTLRPSSLYDLFPMEEFRSIRKELDPKNVLGNDWTDAVFGDA